MLVPVLSGMPRTTLLRVEVSTVNVGGIKEEIQRQWNIPVTLQRIVCSGRVLEDGAQDLPQLCLEGSEPLWLVRCTEGEDEPASVLASLFPSTGAAPSTQQDQEDAAIDILERFCLSVIDDGTGELVWRLTKEERSALDFTRASLRSQAAFFTSYACVLLWDESNVDWATMRLRSLDEHAFAVHSGTAGRFHSSRVGAARVLPVGTVPIGKLKEVLRRSQELIQDVRAECGGEDQRIGWKGKRGHQRTPAFISSIFADVLRTLGTDDASWLTAAKQTPTMPRGGFTDVGMHSDSKHRDTTWPVVEAVVQDRLEAAGQPKLFALAMAQLRLWAAEHAVARCCAGAGGGGELDAVMLMLRDAVERGGAISDAEQHDMAFFDARCAVVRHEMERASRQAAERAAAARHLPPQLALSDFVVRNPTLSPPPAVEAPCTGDGLDQRLAREAANIGWLPAPLADAASWREAEGWLARPQLRDAIARGEATGVQLALANVERLVYTRTELLEAGRGGEVDESEVLALESLVETYRLTQRGFVGSASGGARMQAELRSRETLVVWAAFCLVHQATQGGFPLLGDFGVALDPRDLRHLVLADKLAVDALLRCAAYLHTAGWDVKPCVFSLRAGDGTLDLARQSAEACPEMVRLWEEEVAAASERRERHWVEVQRKKKRIAVLRSEIPPLETRARAADNDGRDFLNAYSAVVAANQLAAGLRLQIVRNEAEITREKTPPPAVLQPLPAERSKAMAVIFFLKMPRRFQALSRLSFMAQQMLVPGVAKIVIPAVDQGGAVAEQSVDIDAPIKRDAPATAWETYYTCGSSGVGRTAQSPLVRLGAMEQVPKQIGGKDVTKYTSKDDGVWHPDDFNARLFWEGGARGAFTLDRRAGGTAFDPFTPLPVSAVVRWFTETLPADRSALQWAMGAPYGASRTRGNDALAFQAFRPPWLWPSEFRAMGALRAAARQQLRTLCVTLHERALPLDDPAVRALMLQTLFHVGELEHDERAPAGSLPRLAWRGDVDTCDGWAALHGELAMLAEELREKPGDHATLLLLAQVASYGGQWHAGCREAARSLGAVASAWADALGDKVDVTSEAELPTLRAKRCLFYMYAVVCHSAGELREEDAAALCEAVVLADYLRISEVETVYDAAVSALTVVTRGIMAARMPEVLLLVKRGTSVLTAAVRRVLVSQTPAALPWIGLEAGAEPSAGCFHAVVAAHVFSVNLLSGTVLYDGLPPSRLPRSIFEDAAYTRSFGARNFEVVLENGVFYTVRRVFGCKYQFFTAGGRLVIREVDPERGIELELLHGTPAGVQAWGQQLPERLRTMHSHWYCREAGVVMLRPIPFHERSVHFVLVHAGEAAGSDSDSSYVEVSPRSGGAGPHVVDRAGTGEWLCCRVPLHLQKVHWLDQRRDASSRELDQLVLLADGHAASLLRTFEPGESLLHVYLKAAPDGPLGDVGEGVTLSVEYPRFDLSFDLERGQLRCKSSFLGTRLARCQLLPDVLIGFEQYLLLEHADGVGVTLLVPEGKVEKDGAGAACVTVSGDDGCDVERRLHAFSVHPRFKGLQASSVEARLQLAALHAATGTHLPEARSQMTGGEVAIELVRYSWVNRPLSLEERAQLLSVRSFSQHTPGLAMVCDGLDVTAAELAFLHSPNLPEPFAPDVDAQAEYVERKQGRRLEARGMLTSEEEVRVAGGAFSAKEASRPLEGTCDVAPPPSTNERQQIVRFLKGLLVEKPPVPGDAVMQGVLVGEEAAGETEVSRRMWRELEESWDMHRAQATVELGEGSESGLERVMQFPATMVANARGVLEQWLLESVSTIPTAVGWGALGCRMRRACNLVPNVTARDLARAACRPELLRTFNPFLSDAAVARLHEGVLEWLQLCVLEDKLGRMEHLARAGFKQDLEKELQELERPEWVRVRDFPHWLVFEVEQQLQIRGNQYTVARHLMENKGAITQLNMGEGKTRVILPMLALHLSSPSSPLLRVHFLSQLLAEAAEYLHACLTASLLNRRIFLLPFHRDVSLDLRRVRLMRQGLERCRAAAGFVCVAPEHRLSLDLKFHELTTHGAPAAVLQLLEELAEVPFFDILDESDELLRHKYQLIYSVGAQERLPAGTERWEVAQDLLWRLQNDPEAARILAQQDVTERARASALPGAFARLRLLPGAALDAVRGRLVRRLAEAMVDAPPYHMRWLKDVRALPALREAVLSFVSEQSSCAEAFTRQMLDLTLDASMGQLRAAAEPGQQLDQLLALRGLLAYGLLEHCLSRRHRVDFGVDRRAGGKRRQVAVPFRSNDTPAERSEFAHPDTLILYTHLAYYDDGLSRAELLEAVKALLQQGKVAREGEYAEWFGASRGQMSKEEQAQLDRLAKIDMESQPLMAVMFRVYAHNMRAVNFWLAMRVLPTETQTFPERLVANAWHLADNAQGNIAGFSGTNDNALLLPLQVAQSAPAGAPRLLATNGKMWDLLGRGIHGQAPEVVRVAPDAGEELPAAVLRAAVARRTSALIDCGALMAGLSNRAVAVRLLALLVQDARGISAVVYFDVGRKTWTVLSQSGRSWSHSSSPIHERDAFVYFDESRCRGTDMKLKADAVAFLTAGPGMCKDKLMQGAARMRQLDKGQQLIFGLAPDVAVKVASANTLDPAHPLCPTHLLRWVMHNTTNATEAGIQEWAAQGSYFATTKGANSQHRALPEVLALEDLYAEKVGTENVCKVVFRSQMRLTARLTAPLAAAEEDIMLGIKGRSDALGGDIEVVATGLEEECEREVECERELEKEVERQVPRKTPCSETLWSPQSLSAALAAAEPSALPAEIGVMRLSHAVQLHLPAELSAIAWDTDADGGDAPGVFVTRNFFETIEERAPAPALGCYLRPLDAVLEFRTGALLLLSESEADQLLPPFWALEAHAQPALGTRLVNLCYLRDRAAGAAPRLGLPTRAAGFLSESGASVAHARACASLFAGGTMFDAEACRAVEKMLESAEARRWARDLTQLRGTQLLFERSNLQEICGFVSGRV